MPAIVVSSPGNAAPTLLSLLLLSRRADSHRYSSELIEGVVRYYTVVRFSGPLTVAPLPGRGGGFSWIDSTE
jgi:hypothetical protein